MSLTTEFNQRQQLRVRLHLSVSSCCHFLKTKPESHTVLKPARIRHQLVHRLEKRNSTLECVVYRIVGSQWQQLDVGFPIYRRGEDEKRRQKNLLLFQSVSEEVGKKKQKLLAFYGSQLKTPPVSFPNQPEQEEDGDDDDEEEEEEGGLLHSPAPSSGNLTDVISLSFSFLLPVQTDLWAGLNCHVTLFVVDAVSGSVACLVVVATVVAGLDATGADCSASMLVVTPLTLLDPPLLLLLSCSLKVSLSSSGSASSSYVSQVGSADGRSGRAAPPADLLVVAETLEERLGSESDRSESQSLSPATESQPSTDTSTAPDPELSESDSLDQDNRDSPDQ